MFVTPLLAAIFVSIQAAPPAGAPSLGPAPTTTTPTAKAEGSKLLGLLGEHLIDAQGKKVDTKTATEGRKVIALYFSAGWCPPCRKFTPKLVEFATKNKESLDFTLVFVSSDRSAEAQAKYMEQYKMPFFAMPFDAAQLKLIKQAYGGSGIPNLVLLNPDGSVIKGSYETDGKYSPRKRKSYIGPDPVLAELGKLIKQDVKKTA